MDNEKVLHNSTEPLVLRPPVGSEVYGQPSLHFRQFSGSSLGTVTAHNLRRRRLLLIYVLCVLITLAIVAGLLFAMFVLNFGPFATHGLHGFGPRSTCHVFSPLLRTSWVESLSADDQVLNVTLSNMPQAHTYWILHLCTEFLTVIRTEDRCFIRPMRAEMVQACNRGYLKLVHDGQGVPDAVEAKIKDELWFTESSSDPPKVIRNSLIMAWCDGLPAFRLVSRRPPNALPNRSPNDLDGTAVGAPPFVNSPPMDDDQTATLDPDSQEVLDQIARDNDQPVLNSEARSLPFPSVVRHRRSVNLADHLNSPNGKLPIYHASGRQCKPVNRLLEDADIMKNAATGSTVSVVRDNIFECT
ncbi:hypothetical protein FBUS_00612 [Fasciolopsis buskii]|uniref:Uncharacterized protein n=1 Tax=Fasciolopsis buskii TaxID=27845 RepID=A0A8E0VG46_9TREM|nr:hypothetical protein FBUS_00612 [Fasciolopsis buski]